MEKFNNLTVLILAAGQSTRLKESKQLLTFKNESLLKIATKKAMILTSNILVVLGHNADKCINEIKGLNVEYKINNNYEEGMGSSLSFGISQISKTQKVLVMLCDMPLLPISHLKNLIKKSNEVKDMIICSKYNKSIGVPCVFPKEYIHTLKNLKGHEGAKKLIKEENYISIELEDSLAIDIDTKEDYIKLIK
ncbi:nucleotidyltransferase family protein [Arcobacter sp. YIC-80]|uniref:nucleotidyltransferase family protein n=1 Tax=unclassified Arcobacter TaxID=2593671 RepID=UPI00384E12EC